MSYSKKFYWKLLYTGSQSKIYYTSSRQNYKTNNIYVMKISKTLYYFPIFIIPSFVYLLFNLKIKYLLSERLNINRGWEKSNNILFNALQRKICFFLKKFELFSLYLLKNFLLFPLYFFYLIWSRFLKTTFFFKKFSFYQFYKPYLRFKNFYFNKRAKRRKFLKKKRYLRQRRYVTEFVGLSIYLSFIILNKKLYKKYKIRSRMHFIKRQVVDFVILPHEKTQERYLLKYPNLTMKRVVYGIYKNKVWFKTKVDYEKKFYDRLRNRFFKLSFGHFGLTKRFMFKKPRVVSYTKLILKRVKDHEIYGIAPWTADFKEVSYTKKFYFKFNKKLVYFRRYFKPLLSRFFFFWINYVPSNYYFPFYFSPFSFVHLFFRQTLFSFTYGHYITLGLSKKVPTKRYYKYRKRRMKKSIRKIMFDWGRIRKKKKKKWKRLRRFHVSRRSLSNFDDISLELRQLRFIFLKFFLNNYRMVPLIKLYRFKKYLSYKVSYPNYLTFSPFYKEANYRVRLFFNVPSLLSVSGGTLVPYSKRVGSFASGFLATYNS